jgi:hypothetical protein
VNRKPVKSAAAFADAMNAAKSAGKQHAVLLVKRGNRTTYVPVRLKD